MIAEKLVFEWERQRDKLVFEWEQERDKIEKDWEEKLTKAEKEKLQAEIDKQQAIIDKQKTELNMINMIKTFINNMYVSGMTVEAICKCTGLSKDEVERNLIKQ